MKKLTTNQTQFVIREYDAPSPYEYGVMSEMAYYTQEEQEDPKTWQEAQIDYANWQQRGWQLIAGESAQKNIYHGFAWINHLTQQVVVVHRGADTFLGMASEVKNIVFDPKALIIKQGLAAVAFTKKAIEAIETKTQKKVSKNILDYTLSFTGHAFGGWLAAWTVRDFYEEYQARCVIFESPGTAAMQELLQSNLQSSNNHFNVDNLDITNYVSPPNIINSFGKHWGRVVQVFPDKLIQIAHT